MAHATQAVAPLVSLAVPGEHSSHRVDATAVAARPAEQAEHSVEPGVLLKRPRAHTRHALVCDAPVVLEYLPAAQASQLSRVALLYLPPAHSTQTAAPEPEIRPATQVVQMPAAPACPA